MLCCKRHNNKLSGGDSRPLERRVRRLSSAAAEPPNARRNQRKKAAVTEPQRTAPNFPRRLFESGSRHC